MNSHEIQHYVHLKTEAALARLALQRLCNQYGLNIDSEMYDYLDLKDLCKTMEDLQREAVEYADNIFNMAQTINQSSSD